MNYIGLLKNIEEVALELNTVNSFYDGDVYSNWNNQEVRYGSINVGLESTTRTDNTVIYNVIIYYADRLLQDKSNKNSIWTDATNTLNSIISNIDNSISYEGPLNIVPFEQKFADYLSGGYVRVGLEVNFDLGECDLDDDKYVVPALFITQNGAYNVTDYEIADVNIPTPTLTELDVTENGTYTAQNYDGYDRVVVNVPEQKPETTLNATIVENGTKTFTPTSGQVYDSAVITTNIKTWQSEYNEAVGTINDLRLEVNDKQRTITTLNANITNLNNQITQKEAEISSLTGQLAAKTEEAAQKTLLIEELSGQIADLNTQKGQLLSQIADLTDEIAAKSAEISRLSDQIAAMPILNVTENGNYDPSGFIGWREVNVDVAPDLETKTITENGTYTSSAHDGFSEVTVNVAEEKPENELEETVTENGTYEYTPQVGHVFSKATFIANIKTWETEYNQALSTIDSLNLTIEEKNATISDLNTTINGLNTQILQKELEIRDLNQQISTKDATISEQANEINALEDEIDHLSADIDDLNAQIGNYLLQINDLNDEISDLNNVITQKDITIAGLQRQIDSVTSKTITENGTYTPGSGVLGWNSVTVNVDNSKPEEGLDAFINSNGTHDFTPDEGHVFNGAHVVVNVQPNLQDMNITTNGDYQAVSPYEGLGVVHVNVPERKPESIYEETITTNGRKIIFPEEGEVFKRVDLDIDVNPPLQNKTVTTNGTYVADRGYYGLDEVTVNVDTRKPEGTFTQRIRQNGNYQFFPPDNYVYNEVDLTVDVGLKQEETLSQTITENGVYHYETDDPLNKVYRDANIAVNVQPSLQAKSTTANGTVTADSGYYGLSSVEVNVDPRRPEEHLIESITTNGTHAFEPTAGSVFADAVVNVNVQPPLQDKTVTSPSATVTADSGYYGLDEVTVNVPLGTKTLEHNGTYDVSQEAVEGWTEVTVDVPLGSTTINRNGTFTPSDVDGWNSVTVALPIGSKTITENGTYTPQPGDTDGAWDEVTVNVQPSLQDKTITENGTYSADQGYYGLDEVTVNVQPSLQDKTVTSPNTVITADQGYYGLNEVTVNVPLGSKTLEHNGEYDVTGENVEGWTNVTVNVPFGSKTLEHNGTYQINPSQEGVDAWDEVTVSVPLGTKNIQHNGQYTPQVSEGVDGYNVVNVNVPLGSTTLYHNGTYPVSGNVDGWNNVTVAVPYGTKTVNHNGTYTIDPSTDNVDAWTGVTVAVPYGTKTIQHNGTYQVDPSTELVDAYDEVVVNVPLGSKSITENGTYTPQASEGVDGYNSVTVNVQPPLQDKTIREDGTYTADQGYYGLGTVTVDTGIKCVEITEAAYNALPQKDQNTYYGITDSVPTGEAVTDTITTNGTYQYAPGAGYNAISNATITVNVPTVAANLDSKVITANGTYTPPTGTDGWDEISVAVPSDQKPEETLTQTISQNGTTTYNPTSGSVFSSATITVNVPEQKPEETLTQTISANGTTTYTPTSGSVFDSAVITVNVPGPDLDTKTITENGTYTAATEDLDGYSEVTVNVQPNVGAKPTTITANGNYTSSTDSLDGYSSVTVNVQPTLQDRTITTNGVYTADSQLGYDGLGEVTVSVPQNTVAAKGTTITANGTYNAQTTDSIDGYTSVTVNVPQPTLTSLTATSNTTYTATGGNGWNEVVVNVPQNTVGAKPSTITTNGTYTSSTDSLDGYSSVVVNVPQNTVGAKPAAITANGTYTSSTDNLDGYSSVLVNVPTITYTELTQSQYDALAVKDNNTIYLIIPDE